YAREIALAAGMSSADAEELFKAAPMHDVGKMGIPYAILQKHLKLRYLKLLKFAHNCSNLTLPQAISNKRKEKSKTPDTILCLAFFMGRDQVLINAIVSPHKYHRRLNPAWPQSSLCI